MSKAVKTLDEKIFDYDMFKADLVSACALKGSTMTRVSTDVVFRSESYLSNAFSVRKLPWNIAVAIAKWMGADLKQYEIKKKPAPKKEKAEPAAKKEEPAEEKEQVSENGWNCQIRVDEEFGMAMMKIFKNGKEIALGRSYTYGHDDTGIVQGISYAAHMCYKMVQQAKMAEESVRVAPESTTDAAAGDEADEECEIPMGPGRVVFKDWIKKYENDNSKAGKLARYVKSHYQQFPATGKKKLRMFIRLNHGDVHLTTFDSLWDMYTKWFETEYMANSLKLKTAV